MRTGDAERRRDFIQAHHPDRGGDPGFFIEGMRSFDTEPETLALEPRPRVVVIRRRSRAARTARAVTQRLRHGRKAPRVH